MVKLRYMSTYLLYSRKSDGMKYFDSPNRPPMEIFNYQVHRAKWLILAKGIMRIPENKKSLLKIWIFYNLMYLLFWKWKRKIFEIHLVYAKNNIIHYTFVLPKCFRLPFMKKSDLEVGPCYTHPDYRGRGLTPYILKEVFKNHATSDIFGLIRHDNEKSIRAVEKIFMQQTGVCNRKEVFGIFPKFIICDGK